MSADTPRLIHLSGLPGCGRTTWCLFEARQVLEAEKRVIWLSRGVTDPERFAQVMHGLDLRHSARFHVLPAGEEFSKALDLLKNLIPQLPSTTLVITEDWVAEDSFELQSMKQSLKELVSGIADSRLKFIVTSCAYSDASGASGPDGIKARSRTWFEELGFETWFLKHVESKMGGRILITPHEQTEFSLSSEGIQSE